VGWRDDDIDVVFLAVGRPRDGGTDCHRSLRIHEDDEARSGLPGRSIHSRMTSNRITALSWSVLEI
jgi:hypothetical protein